jgi:hypothetical protein
MFQLQLSHLKQRLLQGSTDGDWLHLYRLLSSMHYSLWVSYETGRPTAISFSGCGFEQASMCIVPEPTTSFTYTDDRFLRACGVRTAD